MNLACKHLPLLPIRVNFSQNLQILSSLKLSPQTEKGHHNQPPSIPNANGDTSKGINLAQQITGHFTQHSVESHGWVPEECTPKYLPKTKDGSEDVDL
jgi:hypothetical protein